MIIYNKRLSIFEYLIIFLVIIIFLSLFLGYQCKYIEPSYCEISIIKNLFLENGFIENIQSLFLILSIFLLINEIKNFNNHKLIKTFIIFKVLALTYYLGEEISWGQHFFNWNTPEIFNEINNQNETNLHNISNLLDQLPRTFVLLWCGPIPILFYYIKKKFSFKKEFNLIFLPEKKLLVISLILLTFFLPDFFIDKLGLHPGHHIDGKDIKEAFFWDFISFNYIQRLSELHELIFCFYFLIYSIGFSKQKTFTK